MRLAIVSDIHANVAALAAVLADIDTCGVDRIVHLGDLVGYNSFPSETLALMQARGIRGVHGNHDLMACGALSLDHCGPTARRAIAWTRDQLSRADLAYLAALPGELRLGGDVICMHSMLGDPVGRVRGAEAFHEVSLELRRFDPHLEICCTGHTHRPGAVEIGPEGVGDTSAARSASRRGRSGSSIRAASASRATPTQGRPTPSWTANRGSLRSIGSDTTTRACQSTTRVAGSRSKNARDG